MPQVVVIEGEDAAPEAMRPTVALLDRLGLDLQWVHPPIDDRVATRRAIDESATALFGATSGPSAWALFYLRWGKRHLRQRSPDALAARLPEPARAPAGNRPRDRAREPGGPLRRRRGRPRGAPPRRAREPDAAPAGRRPRPGSLRAEGHHGGGRRARRALRVRAGATASKAAGRPRQGHLRHQAQHAAADRRAVPRRWRSTSRAATRTSASRTSSSTTSPAGWSPSRTGSTSSCCRISTATSSPMPRPVSSAASGSPRAAATATATPTSNPSTARRPTSRAAT